MGQSLTRLVYRSRSLLEGTKSDRLAQIEAILQTARPRNHATGITGLLHFDGASFKQIIEGSPDGVERLYEAIACDGRHEELVILELKAVQEREHAAWSMAFVAAITEEEDEPTTRGPRPLREATPGSAL